MLYKRTFWKLQQECLWDVLRNTRYLETNGWKEVMRKEGKDNIIHPCTLLEPPSHRFIECVPSHFSHVRLFVTLWTVAHQTPLSIGLSRQEYWSGLPCPPPGDLPNPGIEPKSLKSLALVGRFLPLVPHRKPLYYQLKKVKA